MCKASMYIDPNGGSDDSFILNIDYASQAQRADGPFVVEIPDINLTFSTVDVAP